MTCAGVSTPITITASQYTQRLCTNFSASSNHSRPCLREQHCSDLGFYFASVAAWAACYRSRVRQALPWLFSQSSGCCPRRKLTQGDPGYEFMAQQLLPGCGLSTRLPHGGCKELRDPLPCGDGDELPVEREQGHRHRSASPSAPGAALGSVLMEGARTGNYPEMSAARKHSTKSSTQ